MLKIGEKGAGEFSDTFLFFIIAICILAMIPGLLSIAEEISTLLTMSSAELIAVDLAGLTTVSGASQGNITMTYENENEKITYDLTIEDRMLAVTGIWVDGELIVGADAPLGKGWGKIGVGDISTSFRDVREFVIEKNRLTTDEGTNDTYNILAK